MTSQYFKDCKTIQEAKELYRSLAMQHHPDRGGDTAIMQEIIAEWEHRCKTQTFGEQDKRNDYTDIDKFADIINQILDLVGIQIEICGSWIWVSGLTKQHKEALKEAGFKFARKKVMWYWRPESQKFRRSKRLSMFEIRCKYGSTVVEPEGPGTLITA